MATLPNAEQNACRGAIPNSAFRIEIWRSHVDSHHEPPPPQSGVQTAYTLGAEGNAERSGRKAEFGVSRRLIPHPDFGIPH